MLLVDQAVERRRDRRTPVSPRSTQSGKINLKMNWPRTSRGRRGSNVETERAPRRKSKLSKKATSEAGGGGAVI